jgi:hypothetical protein
MLNERIRRNAGELRLHGVAESPDELVGRAETEELGYREFLDLVLESELRYLSTKMRHPSFEFSEQPPLSRAC